MKKKLLCMVLVLCLMVTMFPLPAAAQEELVEVTVAGAGVGSSGYYAVREVNKQRVNKGLKEFDQDFTLMELANQRAAEISVYYSENRPNGDDYTTIFSGDYNGTNVKVYEEYTETAQCIAIGCTAEEAIEGWMSDETLKSHFFSATFTEVGIGGFTTNGVTAWVLLFGDAVNQPEGGRIPGAGNQRYVTIKRSDLKLNQPEIQTFDMTDEEKFELTFTMDNPGTDAVDPVLMPDVKISTTDYGTYSAGGVYDENENLLVILEIYQHGTLRVKGRGPGSGTVEYTLYEGQTEPYQLKFNITDVGEHDHTYSGHWEFTEEPIRNDHGRKRQACSVSGEYRWARWADKEAPHPDGYPVEITENPDLFSYSLNITQADPGYYVCIEVEPTSAGIFKGVNCTSSEGVEVSEPTIYYSDNGKRMIIMVPMPEGPLTVTPIVEQKELYDITVNIHGDAGYGAIQVNKPQAYYGERIDLNINLDSTYYFVEDIVFTCQGGQPENLIYMHGETGGRWLFDMPDGDLQIDIYVVERQAYSIYLWHNEGGTITTGPISGTEGSIFRLYVHPEEGYVLHQLLVYTTGTYEPVIRMIYTNEFEIYVPDGDLYIEVYFLNTNNPFVDVKQDAYYYVPVLWAMSNGITAGLDATHFGPNNACTRAQVVTFLWRAAGCPEPTTTEHPFVDIQEGSYYYKAVLWAVENGITAGVDATHFGPNQGCTRAQVTTFLWRACGQPEPLTQENPFRDTNPNSYYYKAVLWAVENGITTGTGNNRFSPDNTCTRGQIVSFLYRTFYG